MSSFLEVIQDYPLTFTFNLVTFYLLLFQFWKFGSFMLYAVWVWIRKLWKVPKAGLLKFSWDYGRWKNSIFQIQDFKYIRSLKIQFEWIFQLIKNLSNLIELWFPHRLTSYISISIFLSHLSQINKKWSSKVNQSIKNNWKVKIWVWIFYSALKLNFHKFYFLKKESQANSSSWKTF